MKEPKKKIKIPYGHSGYLLKKLMKVNDVELEMARLAKNKYQREWRKKNPDKAKRHKLNFFLKLANKEGGGKNDE